MEPCWTRGWRNAYGARGGGGGGGAINDIHDYCYALEKLRAEMYVLHNTPTFLCSFNTYLELAS